MQLSRSIKNIQYKDTKYRLLQTMNEMLLNNPTISIQYYISSYVKNFLNIIIININEHSVYLSYTLRINNIQTEYVIKQPKSIIITQVNYKNKFDEGCIPELDALYLHP